MTNQDIKPPVDKAKPNYYVDKAAMFLAVVEYQEKAREAIELGKEPPGVSNYLGECFLLIAKGMSTKHNFRNYSYIEDMIMNGVEMCLKRVMSFDPSKSSNPFSYFTQVIWYEFISTIQREKSQQERKRNMILTMDTDTFSTLEQEEGDFGISMNDYLLSMGMDSSPPPVKKERQRRSSNSFPLEDLFK